MTNVTIVPGHSRAQLDKLLRREHVRGSYSAATRHSRLLKPTVYGAPRSTPSLEGFLFPDTYQLRKPVDMRALVADQLVTFKRKWAAVDLRYAHAHHVTPYQVLIVASLVEAEATTTHDRPLVAAVFAGQPAATQGAIARGDRGGRPPDADELPVLRHEGVRRRLACVRADVRRLRTTVGAVQRRIREARAARRRVLQMTLER